MKAECQDFYIIRTPNLSIEYFNKFERQELMNSFVRIKSWIVFSERHC